MLFSLDMPPRGKKEKNIPEKSGKKAAGGKIIVRETYHPGAIDDIMDMTD